MDWRQAEILELISMYRESECLWNPLSEEYNDVELRKHTWNDFADHFNKGVEEVKKKIKNLRTSYVVEKKKADRMTAIDSTYEPRLFYFDEMTFLDQVIVLRACALAAQQSDPLQENKPKRSPKRKVMHRPAKIKRFNYDDVEDESPVVESTPCHIPQYDFNAAPTEQEPKQIVIESESKVDASKEQTFCAMLCNELKLLKSEDVYDNVTAEIFTIVKNAKVAERQIIYQPEENDKLTIRTM